MNRCFFSVYLPGFLSDKYNGFFRFQFSVEFRFEALHVLPEQYDIENYIHLEVEDYEISRRKCNKIIELITPPLTSSQKIINSRPVS